MITNKKKERDKKSRDVDVLRAEYFTGERGHQRDKIKQGNIGELNFVCFFLFRRTTHLI